MAVSTANGSLTALVSREREKTIACPAITNKSLFTLQVMPRLLRMGSMGVIYSKGRGSLTAFLKEKNGENLTHREDVR
jgi:hypothetical protein